MLGWWQNAWGGVPPKSGLGSAATAMYKAFKVIKQMMKNHICLASFDEASAANGTCPRDQIADAICIAIGRWHCAADYAGSSPRADVTSENLLRVKNRQGKGYGPVALLWKAVHQLGWQWQHPWKFTCREGSCVDLLEGPDGQWKHVIRQALRDMVLQEKSLLNRKDMQGLWTTASLDFEATTRLLRHSEKKRTQHLTQG